tara:strand:+ start:81 stop:1259 length:1179 start_codon:yes stop_codon:yes gene_type:complete
MKNKKILFITYENPFTKNNGDRIYTCNIIEGLKNVFDTMDFIYFDSNVESPFINEKNEFVKKNLSIPFQTKSNLSFIFSFKPGMIVNRYSTKYLLKLRDLLKSKNYDYIFINHMKMLFTIPTLKLFSANSKIIYLSHNSEFLLSKSLVKNYNSILKKMMYLQDSIKTYFFEKKMLQKCDVVSSISEFDSDFFKRSYGIKKNMILRPVLEMNQDLLDDNDKSIQNIIIVGSFIWGPKKENLLQFLNAKNFNTLKNHNIKLTIVGKADKDFIDKINSLHRGVQMIGPVKNLEPYYNNSKIAIIPEKLGGGFKLKTAEAAMTKTLIIAIKGAITKCNLINGHHFIEKSSFEEIINQIIELQNNENMIDKIISNAYDLVNKEYTIEAIMKTIKNKL